MTERELAEIEARAEAELATGGWSKDDPDVTYDLLRDEVPRLVAEVRRCWAMLEAYREGVGEVDARLASELLSRGISAEVGKPLPVRSTADAASLTLPTTAANTARIVTGH